MSVQTDIEARAAKLREILLYSNAALIAKDGTEAEDLSGLPAAIQALPDSDPELQAKTVTPTGSLFMVEPDAGYDGLSYVMVEGDVNLSPENIAQGVTIYGVTGALEEGAAIPEPYATYIAEAEQVYTGEYANVIYAEGYGTISGKNYQTVMFLLDNWAISAYDAATTEYTHGGFIMVQKEDDGAWELTDYSSTTVGTHYAKNIKAASCYIEYGSTVLFPVGQSGESGGGGGSGDGTFVGVFSPVLGFANGVICDDTGWIAGKFEEVV